MCLCVCACVVYPGLWGPTQKSRGLCGALCGSLWPREALCGPSLVYVGGPLWLYVALSRSMWGALWLYVAIWPREALCGPSLVYVGASLALCGPMAVYVGGSVALCGYMAT